MEQDKDLVNLLLSGQALNTANRALRLRLAFPDGTSDNILLPQRVNGVDAICDGFEYRILCISGEVNLPLKNFIGLAAELQIVTDQGELHSICGFITGASSGESDGGLAAYQLVVRDALAVLSMKTSKRVFREKNEIDIIEVLLGEWRRRNPQLAASFEFEFAPELKQHNFPRREFTMQYNETDGAFVRRLLKRRGIAWFFRAGRAGSPSVPDDGLERPPVHTLVMFDDQTRLRENEAGTVRYHRADGTEERDTITAWSAVRTLQPGSVTGFSWDYGDPLATEFMTTNTRSKVDQGVSGNRIAAGLNDYRVETPHAGDDHSDHAILGRARMAYHDYATKHFYAEGTVRNLHVGEWNGLEGHPEIGQHPDEERRFVLTSLQIAARNNLPEGLSARINRLFSRSLWRMGIAAGVMEDAQPFRCAFTCVRRGIKIVPAFDPRVDVPVARMEHAMVVGPEGEEIHCDRQGRIKVRFQGMRTADHEHSNGAGASDTDADSAWVRNGTVWAGCGPGSLAQFGAIFLPRGRTEVTIGFMNGDPDKPFIVNHAYNNHAPPPALSQRGELPGNRYLSGLRSREGRGSRGNQLRFDDSPGQISAQLASDHGHSELNLGWATEPRADGTGVPRGEGAELRSDEYIALRAAKGLLLSAWKRVEGLGGATGKQLARDEYVSLMRDCSELFGSLGKYAAEHEAMEQDGKAQDELHASFQRWENGSNTAPKGVDGGAPIIGITAPAGISFATSKAIVSYAASNIDTVTQQHLQMTAGQRFNLNAGKGISLFSHHDGIKAIAHHGKFLLQSQHDDTEINSAKNVKLTATEGKLTAMAKVIELIAEDGSFIKIGDGSITFGSNSPLKFKAPDFRFDGPSTMAAEFPTFVDAGADQRFVARYDDAMPGSLDGEACIAQDLTFKISISDDTVAEGKSDAEGKSELLRRDAMHMAQITIFSEGT